MLTLILGLLIFFIPHSVRIVGDGWRSRQIARIGELPWKALYSLISAVGLALTVWGFSLARPEAVVLWKPPSWTHHLTALLTLVSFILVVAAYIPANRIKAAVGHPMAAGVAIWALAHLVSNGRVADLVLFGSYLIWSIFVYRAAHKRDRAGGITYSAGNLVADGVVLAAGVLAWGVFAFFLHQRLMGVNPFG